MALCASIDALAPELLDLQRDLHAHPELSRGEARTTAEVAQRLAAAGIAHRTLPVSGLIADLGAEQPAYRVALRADLDALPVGERTGLPWASTTEGICHACGHDVHIAAMLGAGLALKQHEEALRERGIGVRLLFQPAEEVIPGGARRPARRRARSTASTPSSPCTATPASTSAAWACATAPSPRRPTGSAST